MDDTNSLIEQRKAKLAALRTKGINPFANKFTPDETCEHARSHYTEGREVALAGRITAHREMGKSMFIDLKDQSGRMQIYAQKQALGDEQFDIFKHLDLGDFLGVKGTLFTTKTGEISVKLASFVILAKALRPPPEKWHGLVDTEIRYRQRYLDLMANDEVKEVFLRRSVIIREIRNFFHGRGFVEVETPMMQNIPGGAAAAPFTTHHNALNCNFYLRIAIELFHKRLLVGGIDRIFEIGKNFRNEGLSRKHNPEFTMLEAYQAYGDYETMMELVESLIVNVAENTLDTLFVERPQQRELVSNIAGSLAAAVHRNFVDSISNFSNSEAIKQLQGRLLSFAQSTKEKDSYEAARELCGMVDELKAELRRAVAEMDASFKRLGLLMIRDIESKGQMLHSLAEKTINLTPPWRRVKYKDLIRENAGADWFDLTYAQRLTRAIGFGIDFAGATTGKLKKLHSLAFNMEAGQSERDEYHKQFLAIAGAIIEAKDQPEDFEITGAIFEKLIEPTLIQPTFVTHLPKELVPLAKLSPDDPTTVEVFECCINGQEIAPAYSEQNDPIAQRERLEHQAGGEQQKLDEDFLVALEHGMPPAGGMGMGIDRVCMMLLGQESIRDVILFPQMKPKS
jgi:lysyl-tRNA synthetase class 2